jgi:cytochrome c553
MLRPALIAVLLAISVLPAVSAQEKPAGEFFEKSIRPLLADNCFNCHGPQKQKAGLRLDSRAAMLAGGDNGPVIVPGNPDKSLLVKAVHYKDELRMPPKEQLKPKQIADLANWVKLGAPWPETAAVRVVVKESTFKITPKDREFWSFQPVKNPTPPTVRDASWLKATLDRFIFAKLEEKQLHPVEAADRRTLIRRATFDLIGLPPTPEEVEAFINDPAPDAFAKVVERLLASPHYGERAARHWLDVARYGEDQAHTFEARRYPQGYRYRDWLVRAFNDDMPYDRFITEQLAADLLGPDRKEHLPALGFFALGPVYYGDPKKLDQYDDRIDTLTRGFLGLTVACARCHDHKYDPIATKDYYALAGVVASTDYVEAPLVSNEEVEKAKAALTDKEKKAKTPPKYPYTHAVKEAVKPVTMRVHIRGNPDALGEEAPRHFLSILCKADAPTFTQGSGRLELARAIASSENPLTARVLVNRVWQQHFGTGLVRTPSNFGALGERPTHPELLDYLTNRFMATGWSLKALHRDIMLSASYQMSSCFDPRGYEVDGDNKLLWRMNRRRLEVESWRDAMLAVSGTLDRTVGGPSLDLDNANNRRRTLYGMVSRHELNSLLRLFDFPDPNITSDARTVTTVPLQQLFVLNSEFMARNAKALTSRLSKTPLSDAERIQEAFRALYNRPATDRELDLGLAFLTAGETTGLSRWEQYAQVLLAANEFLYVD